MSITWTFNPVKDYSPYKYNYIKDSLLFDAIINFSENCIVKNGPSGTKCLGMIGDHMVFALTPSANSMDILGREGLASCYSTDGSNTQSNPFIVGGSSGSPYFSNFYGAALLNPKKIIIYYELEKVSIWLATRSTEYFQETKDSSPSYPTDKYGSYSYYKNELSAAEIESAYGDYYIIKKIYVYDASGAHNEPTNPRPKYPGYQYVANGGGFITFSFAAVGLQWDNYSSYVTAYGNGDGVYSINQLLSGYFGASGSITSAMGHIVDYMSLILGDGMKSFMHGVGTRTIDARALSSSGSYRINMWDKAELVKMLNKIQIPFTFTQIDAETKPIEELEDYIEGGQDEDETGGGTGDGDNESDGIELGSVSASGLNAFNRQYAMSATMLNGLSAYLWESTFIDDLKLLFNNPSEGIISCRYFPFAISGGGGENIAIGNVDTGITGYPISGGYDCKFSMGELAISEYFGTAMDYEPYTKISIYLPYIGIRNLNTNEIMGKTLKVTYIVDLQSGACVACIFADAQLLYAYEGKIGIEIPITSTNASQFTASMAMNIAGSAAGLAVSIGTGNAIGAVGSILSAAKGVASTQRHIGGGGLNSASCSIFMPQKCYLIITRPYQSLASSFDDNMGFPCNVTRTLNSLSGYTQCDKVNVKNISGTADEKATIKSLLESGVYIQ